MSHILIVDDEPSLREMLTIFFETQNFSLTAASTVETAIKHLDKENYDIVVSDLRLPDGLGLQILEHIRHQERDTPFIMMTAHASAETAIEAMKNGAYDYVTKPFQLDEIGLLVGRALEHRQLKTENAELKALVHTKREQLTGISQAIQDIRALVKQVAPTRSTILITGESGTGKEQVARAIHRQSQVANGPFIAVNCGAISESLIEAELFGYKKGAFTGANTDRAGFFEEAEGGTIFLDEIGELPINMQVHLLRVLEEKAIRRVGESQERSINCRVLAATNVDLEEAVQQKAFREDLLFRLNIIQIEVPPLRERRADIPLLTSYFVRQISSEMDRPPPELNEAVMTALQSWRWPGNIRELRNVLERACVLSNGSHVDIDALPKKLLEQSTNMSHASVIQTELPHNLPEDGIDLEQILENFERRMIRQALDRAHGKKMKAAERLGLSFRSFRYRAAKLGID